MGIDFSKGTARPSFEALEAAWYKAEIDSAEAAESNKGTEMLKVVYRVIEEGYEGRLLFMYYSLDPETNWAWRTEEWLDQVGLGKKFKSGEDLAEKVVGLELWVKVARQRATKEERENFDREYNNTVKQVSIEDPDLAARDVKPAKAAKGAKATKGRRPARR